MQRRAPVRGWQFFERRVGQVLAMPRRLPLLVVGRARGVPQRDLQRCGLDDVHAVLWRVRVPGSEPTARDLPRRHLLFERCAHVHGMRRRLVLELVWELFVQPVQRRQRVREQGGRPDAVPQGVLQRRLAKDVHLVPRRDIRRLSR